MEMDKEWFIITFKTLYIYIYICSKNCLQSFLFRFLCWDSHTPPSHGEVCMILAYYFVKAQQFWFINHDLWLYILYVSNYQQSVMTQTTPQQVNPVCIWPHMKLCIFWFFPWQHNYSTTSTAFFIVILKSDEINCTKRIIDLIFPGISDMFT